MAGRRPRGLLFGFIATAVKNILAAQVGADDKTFREKVRSHAHVEKRSEVTLGFPVRQVMTGGKP